MQIFYKYKCSIFPPIRYWDIFFLSQDWNHSYINYILPWPWRWDLWTWTFMLFFSSCKSPSSVVIVQVQFLHKLYIGLTLEVGFSQRAFSWCILACLSCSLTLLSSSSLSSWREKSSRICATFLRAIHPRHTRWNRILYNIRMFPYTEPVFLNIYGAQEPIPSNEFRQPM